jgi:hypothetical protein
MMKIRGYHYSNELLKVGDVIKSDQDLYTTYELVHSVYKEVNKNLPDRFGYAYPKPKTHSAGRYCYVVEADVDKVISGNLHHSVFVSMAYNCKTDSSLPLKERLQLRRDNLKKIAEDYFKAEGDDIELISDSWTIIK